MVNINRFNRGILILGSLVVPIVGIIVGIYYMVKPERKNDHLGILCFVLGIVSGVIYYSIPHFF